MELPLGMCHIFNLRSVFFFMGVLSVCMSEYNMYAVPAEVRRADIIEMYEPSCRCCKLNPGPLQGHPVLLITELSPVPRSVQSLSST